MRERERERKNNNKKIFFGILAFTLFFIIFELFIKTILVLNNKPTVYRTAAIGENSYDFLTGYYNKANSKEIVSKKSHYTQATDRYGFNLDGNRTVDKDLSEKNKCEFSIFIIGGSTTQGRALIDRFDPISARLETKLQKKYKNILFQVHNAGTGSFISQQELMLFQNRIFYSLKPDYIIIFNGTNDFAIPIGKNTYLSNSHYYQRVFQENFRKSSDGFFYYIDDFFSKNLSTYFVTKKTLEYLTKTYLFEKDRDDFKENLNNDYLLKKIDRYFFNINIFEKISENNINIDIFFQPQMLPDIIKNLSYNDQKIYENFKKDNSGYFESKQYFYNAVRDRIINYKAKKNNFFEIHDISNILDFKKEGKDESFYSDHVHYTHHSRPIIAEEIYIKIVDKVEKKINKDFKNCN